MVSNSTKYYKESLKKQALKNQKLGKKKKKMRIRAGSPQEEEALKKMIELLTDVKELKKDIVEFIECLLAVHQVKEAQQLQVIECIERIINRENSISILIQLLKPRKH